MARNFANNLAVYHRRKRGGNMKLTEVKKIQGDAVTLSQHLSAALELPQAEVTVNSRTNHVVIKVRLPPLSLSTRQVGVSPS